MVDSEGYKGKLIDVMKITGIATPFVLIFGYIFEISFLMILGLVCGICTILISFISLRFENTNLSIGFQSLDSTSKNVIAVIYFLTIAFFFVAGIGWLLRINALEIFWNLSFFFICIILVSNMSLKDRYKKIETQGIVVNRPERKEARKLFEHGTELYRQKRHKEALIYIDKAIELNPYDRYFWLWRGYVFHDQTDFVQAIICYERCIGIDDNWYSPWFAKSKAHYGLNEFEEALESINESLRINPKYEDAQELYRILSKKLFE